MKRNEQSGSFGTDEENIEKLLYHVEEAGQGGINRRKLKNQLGWGRHKFVRVLHQADALGKVVVLDSRRGSQGRVHTTENKQLHFLEEELENEEEVTKQLKEAVKQLKEADKSEELRVSMQSVFQ